MLAAMTHRSRVLSLDIKAKAFFRPKSYIYKFYMLTHQMVSSPQTLIADGHAEKEFSV